MEYSTSTCTEVGSSTQCVIETSFGTSTATTTLISGDLDYYLSTISSMAVVIGFTALFGFVVIGVILLGKKFTR